MTPSRDEGELAHWAPRGRPIRTGTWAEQAESTADRIELAVAEGRTDDARALARQLPVEAEEIHQLYVAWSLRMAELLGIAGTDPASHEAAWQAWIAHCDAWVPGRPLRTSLS